MVSPTPYLHRLCWKLSASDSWTTHQHRDRVCHATCQRVHNMDFNHQRCAEECYSTVPPSNPKITGLYNKPCKYNSEYGLSASSGYVVKSTRTNVHLNCIDNDCIIIRNVLSKIKITQQSACTWRSCQLKSNSPAMNVSNSTSILMVLKVIQSLS